MTQTNSEGLRGIIILTMYLCPLSIIECKVINTMPTNGEVERQLYIVSMEPIIYGNYQMIGETISS